MAEILIVDDDIHINNMLKEALENEGDLILLDLMLPGLTGEELLPRIKDIPVIVVSAKADVSDKVELLLGGAADYVTKPFEMRELLARITVALRKGGSREESCTITAGELSLDTAAHSVSVSGSEVKLTRTEYAILKLLMRSKGQVVAKLTILDSISMDTPDCTEDSLKIHIHNLRRKLKAVSGKDYISAVWGIGFMLSE